MNDFSEKIGAKNIFGAVGSAKNVPSPGHRPLSSMTPTLVLQDGKAMLAIGCPNGTRIITGVAQVLMHRTFYHRSLIESVSFPRVHHQWSPDEFWIEKGRWPTSTQKALSQLGYTLKEVEFKNYIQAVERNESGVIAVSDPRDVAGAVAR